MIKELKLQFGSHREGEPLEFETTPVTIFVGPNNSGKSKILSEIGQFCQNGPDSQGYNLLKDIAFFSFTEEEVKNEIEHHTLTPRDGENLNADNVIFGNGLVRHQIRNTWPRQFLSSPNQQKQFFCQYYLSYKVLVLNALNRIRLIDSQSLGDLQKTPQNHLSQLFIDDEKRLEVRRIIYEAFSLYFVLDPTLAGQIRIRLSKIPPESNQLERGLHQEAVAFHNNALEIAKASDGVKAFTGIVTSIVAGSPKVTLLDEPEAFLHPSLSFKLGKEISNSAKVNRNRLFVSTHSSNFLMGCIQSGAPINIVRLTYSSDVGTSRLLDKEKIKTLMKDPLLRSTGVLSALFYQHVVVTEGDSDRAFYQEINERLLQFAAEKSLNNCLFINAVGKDTIWKIVKPLREMGIPAVGIYDIDILKNEGSNWTNSLKSSFVPEIQHQPMGQTRSLLKNKFDELDKDMKKDGGVESLSGSDKEAANNLFDQLEEYGIFVVRRGEVEHWLPELNVNANKSLWLTKMFEAMGSDPENSDYVKPNNTDVWAFMERIKRWMSNGERKGIPN